MAIDRSSGISLLTSSPPKASSSALRYAADDIACSPLLTNRTALVGVNEERTVPLIAA